jgi:tetratricopeptide (TPR) repeat protein
VDFAAKGAWMKKVLLTWGQLLVLAVMATAGISAGASAEQQATIKDPAENTAYTHAQNAGDAWDRATALEAFLARYPNSAAKVAALQELIEAYQLTGNLSKAEETAKRIIAVDDSNVKALLVVTVFSRQQVTDANLTKLDDLCSSSQRGITVWPSWQKPEGVTDADFGNMKKGVAGLFYGGAAFCALSKRAYGVARENYLKALAINPEDMANNLQLGMAELESSPSDQNGFLYLAKALHLAEEQHNRTAMASIEQYGLSKYKKQNGSDDGWDSFISAALHTAPPSATTASSKKGPTDAELACQAMKENAVDDLSFGDWEFVLQQRDAGACNIEAADKVWAAIQERGKTPVQLPVKVISSSLNNLRVALTEENQKSNQVDLVITMENQMQNPPAAGAMVNIIGVFTGYQLNPFFFSMAQGKLAAEPAKN